MEIMAKPEDHRNRWALVLASVMSIFIFTGFAFYKGFIGFEMGLPGQSGGKKQAAAVVAADKLPSPIENTKKTFGNAFDKIGAQYQEFKESVSAVVVPFVTGVDIYERK